MTNHEDTVIVTGSTGFIGSALINKFAARFALIGLDRATAHQPPPAAECVCIDLTSEKAVAAGLRRVRTAYGNQIASVIHLASYFDLTGEPNPLYDEIAVHGTEKLLRAVQSFEVEQFVFASSMLAHKAGQRGNVISEDSPLQSNLPYRTSKIKAEHLIHEQHGPIPVLYLRPAGVYDDLCRNAFLANQIARIYEKDPTGHLYPGELRTGQSCLHLDHLTDAVSRLIERRKELPSELALLLGEPEVMGYGDLQAEIGRLIHGEPWETRQIPKTLAKTGAWVQHNVLGEDLFIRPWMVDIADDHYAVDITRARKLLGWEPQHSLRDTLPKIITALKADPPAWYRANKLNAAQVADRGAKARARQTFRCRARNDACRTHGRHRRHGRDGRDGLANDLGAFSGGRPRRLASHQSVSVRPVRSSRGRHSSRHYAGARSLGANPAQCTNRVERCRLRRVADAVWLARPVASLLMGTMGHNGRRSLAVICAFVLLNAKRCSLCEQHDHRGARDRFFRAGTDDAGHEP